MPSPDELLDISFISLDRRLRNHVSDYLRFGRNPRFPSTLNAAGRKAISVIPLEARADFYDVIDEVDDLMLLRLGRLLAVTEHRRGPEHVPASVWAVLWDGLRAQLHDRRRSKDNHEFTLMSIPRLEQLLQLEGVRPDAVAELVIDTLVGTSNGAIEFAPRGLQAMPGLAAYVADHTDDLLHSLPRFGESAHLELIRLASTHPLAERIAVLLAAYTIADKALRTAVMPVLSSLPVAIQVGVMESRYAGSISAVERTRAIAAIERIPDTAAAIGVLERALVQTKGAAASELDQAIQRLAIFELAGVPDHIVAPPMIPLAENELDDESAQSIRIALLDFAARRRKALPALRKAADDFRKENPKQYADYEVDSAEKLIRETELTLDALPEIVEYLSGRAAHPGVRLLRPLLYVGVNERITGFEAANWARLCATPGANKHARMMLKGQGDVSDARAIADVLVRAGCTEIEADAVIIKSYFTENWYAPTLTPDQMVPFMADHPEVFDIVLGLASGEPPVAFADLRHRVLEVLKASPELPARYLSVVTSLATGAAKTHRAAAQQVLEQHGLARRIVEEALRSTSVDSRVAAVLWLESLGDPDVGEVLAGQLEREKSVPVRATLIAALERLGRDIRALLSHEALEVEALSALKKGVPARLSWFPFADLPECRYDDGEPVPLVVLRWWVTLAITLKDLFGAGLVPLYLRTLDSGDAAVLGRFVLLTWLAHDSAPMEDEQVMLEAMEVVARYERAVAAFAPDDPGIRLSVTEALDVFDRERERLTGLTPSALGDRGILSLASYVPGLELAEIVRQFMRRQHLKRAQIEALLAVLSQSQSAESLQLLVATARRYRTASVQERARVLLEQVAESRGWTVEQIADRMIPAVGFDERRFLIFDYGPRTFTGRLGTSLAIELETDEGAPVRSLPAPRVDDALASDAKSAFSSARKELAAVVSLQRRRLYDAMCLRREWGGADWREFLLDHPIVGILASGLVWDVNGSLVRPDLDGVARKLDGSKVVVEGTAVVRIAHTTTVDAAVIEQWRDSPSLVNLGFDQFRASAVVLGGTESVLSELDGSDYESFTLRSRLTKLEWARGEVGDGPRFDEYVKAFTSASLTGVISFSGSSVPETNIPVELGELSVRRGVGRGSGTPVRFSDVPPALLAELVADYRSLVE